MPAIVNYKLNNIESLSLLAPLEKQVIEMRLGLGVYKNRHTFKQCAALLTKLLDNGEIINERKARQIESKAIMKLRHPSRKCRVLIKGWDY
jgi:DNA-directed RNA polymerase sigma subunit (sigma70/sigma32)